VLPFVIDGAHTGRHARWQADAFRISCAPRVAAMKRFLSSLGLVAILFFAANGPALADVSSLTLNSKVYLSDSKTSATATGTIVCPIGNSVDVTVVVVQSSGQVDGAATGSDTVICTGQVQDYSVTVPVAIGSSLKKGPAVAVFSAFDEGDPNDFTDDSSFPTQTQGVKIS
jgi:hypothetical protein